jgi:hypothetical protein
MMNEFRSYRRWLRFSLRSCLVATLAICCGLAYWVRQQQGQRFAFQGDSGKWGFVSEHGWVVTEPQYPHALDYQDGLARVQIDDRLCYIDRNGAVQFKLPPDADSTMRLTEGCLWFEANDKWGLCDKQGEVIVEPTYTEAFPFVEGMAQVYVGGTRDWFDGFLEGGKWGYVNRAGELAIPARYEFSNDFSDGLAQVSDSDGTKFIDKTGKVVVELGEGSAGDFREGVAPVHISSKDGKGWLTRFINKRGETEFTIDGYAEEFHEGMAAFRTSNQAGFLDRRGRVAIEPIFAEVFDFHEGMAAVRPKKTTGYYNKGDLWGYIDKRGKFVIRPRFNEVESFRGGVAKVHVGGTLAETSHHVFWEGGEWLLIDKRGKELRKLHESG